MVSLSALSSLRASPGTLEALWAESPLIPLRTRIRTLEPLRTKISLVALVALQSLESESLEALITLITLNPGTTQSLVALSTLESKALEALGPCARDALVPLIALSTGTR